MTKQELINTIAERAEINKIDVEHAINAAFDVAKETIANGDSIFIRGFGTLSPKRRQAKVARNITAGTSVVVPETIVPHFKPCKAFKGQVNEIQIIND